MSTPNELWIIRHPGTLERIVCDSFEECMAKWFEGFNLPIRVAAEPDAESYQRVKDYYARLKP